MIPIGTGSGSLSSSSNGFVFFRERSERNRVRTNGARHGNENVRRRQRPRASLFDMFKRKKRKDEDEFDELKEMRGRMNEIETEEELLDILKKNKDRLMIVKVATSFCGPCKIMKPTFELFSANYTDALFVYVLSDKNEKTKKLSDSLRVQEVPSFRFFRSEEQVWQYSGANEKMLRMTIVDQLREGERR